jgi:hypothetical protein
VNLFSCSYVLATLSNCEKPLKTEKTDFLKLYIYKKMNTKTCKSCGIEKHKTDDFPKNGRIFRAICKVCHSDKQKKRYDEDKETYLINKKKYYEENKQSIIVKNKEYRKENRDKICQQKNNYYQLNREEILKKTQTKDYKEKRNKYLQNRRKEDKTFALICAYRARLNEVLHKQKKNTYIEYLNCKREQFLEWIEFQIKDPLKWETYGKDWVIDHVIPIDFFDLEQDEQRYMCFSWFNLRPLLIKDNLSKSNKIYIEAVEQHQNVLNNFKNVSYWYQADIEIYQWLRQKLGYGKNPSVLGNSQPSFQSCIIIQTEEGSTTKC